MLTFWTPRCLIKDVLLIFGFVVYSSCVTGRVNLVEQGQAKLVTVPSKTHVFEKSVVFQDDGELIVYGKIKNRTGFCARQGHVDLVIIGPKGTILRQASIPYVNRGQRREGWSGAHFRVRFRQKLASNSIIRLAFDDENCFATVRDDHNMAKPSERAER